MLRSSRLILLSVRPNGRIVLPGCYQAVAFSSAGEPARTPRRIRRQDSELVRMKSIEIDVENASNADKLIESLTAVQRETVEEKVPWFLENMPPQYMNQVPISDRLQHLATLCAIPDLDSMPEIVSNDSEGKSVSIISDGKSLGQLEKQLAKFHWRQLGGLKVFKSIDGRVSINMFEFSEDGSPKEEMVEDEDLIPTELIQYTKDILDGHFLNDSLHAPPSNMFEFNELKKYISLCKPGFAWKSSPRRFCKQMSLYYALIDKGLDDIVVDVESNWGGSQQYMITLALSNALVPPTLQRVCRYLESRNLMIERAHLDAVGIDSKDTGQSDNNEVFLLRVLAAPTSKDDWLESEPKIRRDIQQNLGTVAKWLDERALKLCTEETYLHDYATDYPSNIENTDFAVKGELISPFDAEICVALFDLVHAILASRDPYGFSRSNIARVIKRKQTMQIVDLFKRRFDPENSYNEQDDDAFNARVSEIRASIDADVELELHKEILELMLNAVQSTLRTNAFVNGRYSLALRLDPKICMDNSDNLRNSVPFGVFFISGRRFTGFHVRFRDIARGGLRVVTPSSQEMFAIESARQFNECYDLAFAQQLKNKDIAEGGSKAVCLINMDQISASDKQFVIRKYVKSMVNSLLDCLTPEEKTKERIRDYYGQNELLYLGPDEQIAPEHINWIVERAAERGYPSPSAFMSSKPDAGINHKEYGVTSEGVAVFLDVALKETGVLNENKDDFTVKITGGPDGDVAGNMLNILYRNYGPKAKVVGIADGTACVECEDGIDWDELLRLFHEVLPLSEINPSKLSDKAKVYLVDTEEGANMRNTMHNRVKADAFIPAGGRPATINDSNWEKFLEDGVPSSKLIVEGANLFLTPNARAKLHAEAGCSIVKDSSANKCGVICSSYEIISSMLLSKENFLQIKESFVPQVLEKLRLLAEREAKLMFREYKQNPRPLPDISTDISAAINRTTDALHVALSKENITEEQYEELFPVLQDFLPEKIIEKCWDDLKEKIPPTYIRNLLATILAGELVYREGVEYVNRISDSSLSKMAIEYLDKRRSVDFLKRKVTTGEELSPSEIKTIVSLLEFGGARTAIEFGGIDNVRS